MNLRIVAAILKKDVRSLYPLILVVTLLFTGDVLLMRLDLVAAWGPLRTPVLLLAGTALILAVFQLDPPVSQVDDCCAVPCRGLNYSPRSWCCCLPFCDCRRW
jgi:hypothetical protein